MIVQAVQWGNGTTNVRNLRNNIIYKTYYYTYFFSLLHMLHYELACLIVKLIKLKIKISRFLF